MAQAKGIRSIGQSKSFAIIAEMEAEEMSFHLNRRTGALTRVLDRGSRSIQFVMQALVFNVVPTILELGMVSTILTIKKNRMEKVLPIRISQ